MPLLTKTDRVSIRYKIQELERLASQRPPGHLQDFLQAASHRSADGRYIFVPRELAAILSDKYRQHWQPEVAQAKSKKTGPRWWKAYQGTRKQEEVQALVENIFQFDRDPAHELISKHRDVAMAKVGNRRLSPCAMNTIVNATIFDFIYDLNSHESVPTSTH